MDKGISSLFREWLSAFDAVQTASSKDAIWRSDELTEIEKQLGAAPAEGLQGVGIKLALHCFLQDHTDASSTLAECAYRDVVRLTGNDPLVDITNRFKKPT
jgi:hypothetical protein